ncbi:MAG: hypothetical protein KF861_10030 [Planctomycetaceae bacterium]|nr:hypothetical protein [Planctomycetaceae bacterium]
MTHQEDQHSADTVPDQPTMELLDGAQAPTPTCCSMTGRIARGMLYGVLLLSGTSLLAISAVPELTNYLSFLPGGQEKGTCHLSSGSCTALDVAALPSFEGSPCCPLSAAMVRSEGCSSSCQDAAAVAGVSGDSPACCQKSGSCCEDEGACPLAALAKTVVETADDQSLEGALAKLPLADETAPSTDVDGPPAPPLAE